MNSSNTVRVVAPKRSSRFLIAKRLIQLAVTAWVLPRLACYFVGRRLLGDRAFSAACESIARIPGLRGVYLRQAFYRATLNSCGQDVYFGWNSAFSMHQAEIGERAYIGRFCSIGFAKIGAEVMLADQVQILSGGREHCSAEGDQSMHEQAQTFRKVIIGDGAWIGAGAVVMANVGAGSVIGAGAVVNTPIPPSCVAVGVPAKVIKQIAPEEPLDESVGLAEKEAAKQTQLRDGLTAS